MIVGASRVPRLSKDMVHSSRTPELYTIQIDFLGYESVDAVPSATKTMISETETGSMSGPLVGVLALQGAFEEHQKCLEAVGCRTRQVSTIALSIVEVPLARSGAM
jgi:hypothetical protein